MSVQNFIFERMNLVALKHVEDDQFEVLTPPGQWFAELWPAAYKRGPLSLRGPSPFLDNFLHDAGYHWTGETPEQTLKSGPFLETSPVTEETYPLEASAFVADDERVLILTNLGDSYQETLNLLQAARENLLSQEALEVEVSKRTQEIRDRESEVAGRLIYAAGFRDEETGSHIRRIGLYAAEMGRALGWSQRDIDDIRMAAPMHDVGKIGIEDAILKKPGKLSEPEFARMKEHASLGREMLSGSDISMIQMASDIAGGHHENWDGSGYPEGLKGDAIPISARIVSIVDVYDALVHKRVYKEAFLEEDAIITMKGMRGKKFDPGLFDLFLENLVTMRMIKDSIVDE